MVGLVFGMGTSEAEGMLTSEITASLHPPEICLLKPCIVLIKVSAVLIKLVPVALLCLKLHARHLLWHPQGVLEKVWGLSVFIFYI